MKTHKIYKVQSRLNDGPWKTLYVPFTNYNQAAMYFSGTCAHNGYACRLLEGKKVIAHKAD